jgi:hypothetical protein
MSTFGKTNVGGTTDTMPTSYIQVFGPYSPAENGTLESMSLYTNATGITFKMLVYADNGGTPVGGALIDKTGDVASVAGDWATGNVLTGIAVFAGTNYYIGIMQNGTISGKADTDATKTNYYKGSQTYGTEPDPFPSSPSTDTLIKSLYATYTPSIAASTIYLKGRARNRFIFTGVSAG